MKNAFDVIDYLNDVYGDDNMRKVAYLKRMIKEFKELIKLYKKQGVV